MKPQDTNGRTVDANKSLKTWRMFSMETILKSAQHLRNIMSLIFQAFHVNVSQKQLKGF